MNEKKIILVDGNNFFASCEQVFDASLRNKPLCILSNNDGCIIARSNEAKRLGIKMGMPYFMAKKEFPNAIYKSSNFTLYHEMSQRMMQLLSKYSDLIDIYSIDEAFLDITGMDKIFKKSYQNLIKEIKQDIEKNIGLSVSIGLAPTAILAKTANHIAKKSAGVYIIEKNMISNELQNLPVEEIWGVGKNIARKLRSYGIFYGIDILKKEDNFYRTILGKKGLELKYELMGESVIPITGIIQKPKSIQRTRAFPEFSANKEYIKTEIMLHLHNLCKKLRSNNLETGAISVMLRTKDFKIVYFGDSVLNPTNSELTLSEIVNKLFNIIYKEGIVYRSAGIWASNLVDIQKQQLSLFERNEDKKNKKISEVIDKLESKYGKGTLSIGRTGLKSIMEKHKYKSTLNTNATDKRS
ncbi:Y-family DNA polymerase [bacterium]|nr:Y-family DNA polymerase [bacterium]